MALSKKRISPGELVDCTSWKGKEFDNNIINFDSKKIELIKKHREYYTYKEESSELGGFYSDNGTPIKFWGTKEDYLKLKI